MGHKVITALQVHKEPRVLKVHKDLQVPQVHRVDKEILELKV